MHPTGATQIQRSRSNQRTQRSPVALKTIGVLSLVILIGLWLRLDSLWVTNFRIDADEAIVGLMAKHMLEGAQVPTFYYGQHYMGSLEPILVAAAFKALGVGLVGLKLIPLIFSVGLIALAWAMAREMAGERAGLIAAWIMAVAPAPLLIWSSKARGGFIELIVLGGIALLWTFREFRKPKPSYLGTAKIGFVVGVGWWVNNQILYFMVPIAVGYLFIALNEQQPWLSRLRTLVTLGLTGTSTFFLGSLPFWLYNFTHDFASFGLFGRSTKKEALDHLQGVFSTALPMLFGAKHFWDERQVFQGATALSYLVYGGVLLYLMVSELWRLRARKRLTAIGYDPIFLLSVMVAVVIAIFSVSSFGYLYRAPRYLLPLYLPGLVLVAVGISRLIVPAQVGEKNRFLPVAFGYLALGCVTALNLLSYWYPSRAIPGEPFVYNGQRVSQRNDELIALLESKDIHYVRTNYWIGYRLAFETGERVRFSVFEDPQTVRIDDYEEASAKWLYDEIPLVLVPSQEAVVTSALNVLGYVYEVQRAGGYLVVFNIRSLFPPPRPIPATNVVPEASLHPENARLALDGDLTTRWASAMPQQAGMSFSLNFKEPLETSGMQYKLAKWWHDYPRSLMVIGEGPQGEVVLLSEEQYQAVRYLAKGDAEVVIRWPARVLQKITLIEKGNDPIFDWSIAEAAALQ